MNNSFLIHVLKYVFYVLKINVINSTIMIYLTTKCNYIINKNNKEN